MQQSYAPLGLKKVWSLLPISQDISLAKMKGKEKECFPVRPVDDGNLARKF